MLCFVKPLGNIVLQVINKSAFNINNLITTAYETFIMGEGLWFLLCLFWAELLLYLIIKILKNDKKKNNSGNFGTFNYSKYLFEIY